MLLVLYLKMLYIADADMNVADGIFVSVSVILFILVLRFIYLLFVDDGVLECCLYYT